MVRESFLNSTLTFYFKDLKSFLSNSSNSTTANNDSCDTILGQQRAIHNLTLRQGEEEHQRVRKNLTLVIEGLREQLEEREEECLEKERSFRKCDTVFHKCLNGAYHRNLEMAALKESIVKHNETVSIFELKIKALKSKMRKMRKKIIILKGKRGKKGKNKKSN